MASTDVKLCVLQVLYKKEIQDKQNPDVTKNFLMMTMNNSEQTIFNIQYSTYLQPTMYGVR